MPSLHLDVESRSTVDLKKAGAPAYWEHPSTDVICACYAADDDQVLTWMRGDPVPPVIERAVAEGWRVYAHNAGFEWWAWKEVLGPRYGWPIVDPRSLRCTAAMAAAMSLPRSLDHVSEVLDLKHKKDGEGHRLMLQLCKPRRTDPDGTVVWWDDPEKIKRLALYCARDVEAERELTARVRPLIPEEQALFHLDREINDRGVKIDIPGIRAARDCVWRATELLNTELQTLTGGAIRKVTEAGKLAEWLTDRGVDLQVVDWKATKAAQAAEDIRREAGEDARPESDQVIFRNSVDKARITKALKVETDPVTRRVLAIRQEAARSSTAKLTSFLDHVSPDGRVKENMMYCGAGTGRWAAKGVQLHNLIRPTFEYPAIQSALAHLADREPLNWLDLLGQPLDVIANCLRSLIIAEPGCELVFGDYANIEGRVLAWLAGEGWKLEAFRSYDLGTGPNIYLLSAARIFGVPVETLTKDSPEYQPGKVGELACGFGGGVGAYQAMAAGYNVEVSDDTAEDIKTEWRGAHPETVRFWAELEDAAMRAVACPDTTVWAGEIQRDNRYEPRKGKIAFRRHQSILWMMLPSGRKLAYISPRIALKVMPWRDADGGKVERDAVWFMGQNPVTNRWEPQSAYGGLWAENATQATARDVMARAMLRMAAHGWPLVLTVHDEIIAEAPRGLIDPHEFRTEMVRPQPWFAGLPLAASITVGPRYRK